MSPLSVKLLLLALLLHQSIGVIYDNCYECDEEPICCDDPDTDTTTNGEVITDELICKHWTSSRVQSFGAAGGAPLDVCFGAFSGTELSSTSYIYTCSDDNTTVEYWSYTGSSDCNPDTATTETMLPFSFDPITNSDTDLFECSGSPCPYYIIEDGTSHPTQTCPYDIGKDYLDGADDYATWHLKLLLQGCQSFDGTTSLLLKCSDSTSGGITMLNFNNPICNVDGLINGEEIFESGTIECNYGTGRSVYCFDQDITPVTTSSSQSTSSIISTTTSQSITTLTTNSGSNGTTQTATETTNLVIGSNGYQCIAIYYIYVIFACILLNF